MTEELEQSQVTVSKQQRIKSRFARGFCPILYIHAPSFWFESFGIAKGVASNEGEESSELSGNCRPRGHLYINDFFHDRFPQSELDSCLPNSRMDLTYELLGC